MSESASQPVKISLWMRTRRWSAQNPVTAFVWLCFMAFLLFLAMPYLYYFWARFSYKPDLVAKGQLRDYDTGEPMPGVYVAVLVMPSGHAEWPTFDIGWGSSGGGPYYCSPASAVVKTDAEGRYYYRVSHQEITQGEYEGYYTGSFYYLRAYKHGYETVDARTGKPYYDFINWTDGRRTISRTISPDFPEKSWYKAIALRKIPPGPDAEAQLRNAHDLGCSVSPDAKRIRGWVERADAIGQDAWHDWCTPEGARHQDRSRDAFYSTEERIGELRGFISQFAFSGDDARRAVERQRKDSPFRNPSDIYKKLTPTYKTFFQNISSEQPTQNFTVEEQAALCNYWQTRREQLLLWELPQ